MTYTRLRWQGSGSKPAAASKFSGLGHGHTAARSDSALGVLRALAHRSWDFKLSGPGKQCGFVGGF